MKNLKFLIALAIGGLLMLSCSENEIMTPVYDSSGELMMKTTGNDAPNGVHYNLNIHDACELGSPHSQVANQ